MENAAASDDSSSVDIINNYLRRRLWRINDDLSSAKATMCLIILYPFLVCTGTLLLNIGATLLYMSVILIALKLDRGATMTAILTKMAECYMLWEKIYLNIALPVVLFVSYLLFWILIGRKLNEAAEESASKRLSPEMADYYRFWRTIYIVVLHVVLSAVATHPLNVPYFVFALFCFFWCAGVKLYKVEVALHDGAESSEIRRHLRSEAAVFDLV